MRINIRFFGGSGASSGINRGGASSSRETRVSSASKTVTFDRKGLKFNELNKKAVSAILNAPVGTKIEYKHIGFGSYSEGQYIITERGGGKKMLTNINNEGKRTGQWLLNRSNVNKYLGMAWEIKMIQSK